MGGGGDRYIYSISLSRDADIYTCIVLGGGGGGGGGGVYIHVSN